MGYTYNSYRKPGRPEKYPWTTMGVGQKFTIDKNIVDSKMQVANKNTIMKARGMPHLFECDTHPIYTNRCIVTRVR